MESLDSMKKWISERLQNFELNDEVYVDYIVAIVQEDNTKVEEKVGGIIDYLSAATSENLEPLKKELLEWITSFDETKKKQKEEQKLQKQKEEQMKLAKMKQEIQVKVDEYFDEITYKPLSKEERKQKDIILSRYSLQEEKLDENGELTIVDKNEKSASNSQSGIPSNTNATRIAQEEQQKRERARQLHQQKLQKEKELREKEEKKKEQAKKKTQKQERRKGFG